MVLRVFRRSIEEIEPDIMNAENALESLIKDMFRLLIEIEKTQSGKLLFKLNDIRIRLDSQQ